MQERNYQQCTRCLMDTTDLLIQFDENGHCNLCTEFFAGAEEICIQEGGE